jgi:hypothetical protein
VRRLGLQTMSVVELGTTVQMDFAFDLNGTASAFNARAAPEVSGTYANVAATITQLAPGSYRAIVTKGGSAWYFLPDSP